MTLGTITDHRIVRAPAKAGSYADVSVLLADGALAHIRLEYIGGELYGRTALTPTCESLEAVIHGVSSPQAAASILQDTAEVAKEWPAYIRDAKNLCRRGPRPPICPRVVVGQMLRLRLPVAYGTLAYLDIGIVQAITPHTA